MAAKKRVVNKSRQALLIPVIDAQGAGVSMKRLQVGDSIELLEGQISPQVEFMAHRNQLLIQEVPAARPAKSSKDEN